MQKADKATNGELRLLSVLTTNPGKSLQLDPKDFPGVARIIEAIKALTVKNQPVTCLGLYRENPNHEDFLTYSEGRTHFTVPSLLPVILHEIAIEKRVSTWQEIRYQVGCCSDPIAGLKLLENGVKAMTGQVVEV